MSRWLLALIVCLPLALIGEVLHLAPLIIFVLSALAIVPLAGAISNATEDLSEVTGPRLGGLLNATFGNLAELILSIFTLAAGLDDVVRAAISGSIISNALLVLGVSMLFGGLRHGPQRFKPRDAGQYSTMLALAVIGLVVPSIIDITGGPIPNNHISVRAEGTLSLVVAAILLVSYVVYILFSVFGVRATSRRSRRHAAQDRALGASALLTRPRRPHLALRKQATPAEHQTTTANDQGAEKDASSTAQSRPSTDRNHEPVAGSEEQPKQSGIPWRTIGVLAGATVCVAIASEILVGSIEPVAHQLGLSTFFVGLIFLPLVGNAAEFATAVRVALADDMEATMAVAAGSSIQVALLVAPLLILISPLFGHVLILEFTQIELVIFALVAALYALVSLDGETTWLEGAQLIAFYLIVAAGAFLVP